MADGRVDPPPLLENVPIDEDLFISARQDPIEESVTKITNGTNEPMDISKLKLSEPNREMENVPINTNPVILDAVEKAELNGGDKFLEISIGESQKVGEGMGAYVAYRISTRTNMPIFKRQEFSVTRRFSDFLGLHDKLIEKYLKVGRIIPPAPEKSVIGMTKIKMGSSTETAQNNGSEFVERRRAALERYLKRTAQHPALIVDPDFRDFLEDDVELPKATSTSALSSAGVMRLFNKVGETVNKITYKMDETDPWFEEKLAHIDGLETQLRKLHGNVEAMVTYRRELANLTNGVSSSAAMLSCCEDHSTLSRALTKLAETEEKVESLLLEQANTDFFILCELLKDYIGLLGAVRDAFHERTKLFQHWQHSQQMLAKKREMKAKYGLQNRTDKMDQANAEVVEWEAKVDRGQESFDKISQMIKSEMERFEKCRIQDFKVMFIKYLENHLEHQAQLVKYWESFLPEAKAIA
ncbi:sorting nexin-2-like [Anthonomus grandis grandis]|uniref:sorting nexin-2-like n=1 Tax=Anthonomus grandis grandis TaxID=2921223 RepID=UPI00216578EC|nr:sorting nexin-2-like [Anthonomus grandis grandis]XP_050306040.1 sorting nexin-2-like [Anthonomus grandis grandis]XP_050306041.1 sorting nexin-2-like [Anthonomus grandis grandis]